MSQKGTLGAKSEEPKMIYLCTAHIFFGDTISTVGIDGDFLSGFNIAGANEYLLALKILIALAILFVVWRPHLRTCSIR